MVLLLLKPNPHPSLLRQTAQFLKATSVPSSTTPRFPRTHNFYSTTTSPTTIKITDIPAPSSGRIRLIHLNRPSAKNALSQTLVRELSEEIRSIASEYDSAGAEIPPAKIFGGAAGLNNKGPTRALIIASEDPSVFCAGADLKERRGMTASETAGFLANLRGAFKNLAALPIPTISAVSSVALGGGLELALSTHFRIMSTTSIVGLPETRLGIVPGAGGTYRLPAIIGISRARDLIVTGRRVSGQEAYFLGLADRLVSVDVEEAAKDGGKDGVLKKAKELVEKEAIDMAAEICLGGPIAVRAALEAVGWAQEEAENRAYDKVVGTQDRDEALKAFAEKRRPVFTGR